MASDKQRIAQNTLFLYVRMFLIIIVSLYTVRVVIRTLNVTDYGIYMAVGGIVLALSFLSQTIASASQRFFAYELGRKDFCQLRHTFSMIFIVYIITTHFHCSNPIIINFRYSQVKHIILY